MHKYNCLNPFLKESISKTSKETINFGKKLVSIINCGSSLILDADLGVGKTTLTKGIALGLNIKKNITSPTFTLINFYKGEKFNLCHIDLYRINSLKEFNQLGLEEYCVKNNLLVIEWGKSFIKNITNQIIIIEIKIKNNAGHRKIRVLNDNISP